MILHVDEQVEFVLQSGLVLCLTHGCLCNRQERIGVHNDGSQIWIFVKLAKIGRLEDLEYFKSAPNGRGTTSQHRS
jgi:hypothetical protein